MVHILVVTVSFRLFFSLWSFLYDLFASFPKVVFWYCFVLHLDFFYFTVLAHFASLFTPFSLWGRFVSPCDSCSCLCAMLWLFVISFYHHYVYLGSITVTFLFVWGFFLSFYGCMFSGIYLRPGFSAWTFSLTPFIMSIIRKHLHQHDSNRF